MQSGDIITEKESAYVEELERLWDMVSDMVESGRLAEADIPDDYQALVSQMVKLGAFEVRDERVGAYQHSSCRP